MIRLLNLSIRAYNKLRTDGYIVLNDLVEPELIKSTLKGFRDWHTDFCEKTGLKEPPSAHGIIQSLHVGQDERIWKLRESTNIRAVFAGVYALFRSDGCKLEAIRAIKVELLTTNLLVSFDAVAHRVAIRATKNKYWPDEKELIKTDWTHVDQRTDLNIPKGDIDCIQGLVSLLDMPENGHTFACLKGSHVAHTEIFSKIKKQSDYLMLKKVPEMTNEKILELHKRFEPIRVSAKAGSLVLWRSDLFHRSVDSIVEKPVERFVVYVCYQPRENAVKWRMSKGMTLPRLLKKRVQIYENARNTSHNPLRFKVFSEKAQTWGDEKLKRANELALGIIQRPIYPPTTELRRKLVGYE